MIWLVVIAGAVALNMVPAFMPPTWALLAWAHLNHGLPILPLAAVGALSAGLGRTLLALGARAVGPRVLPARWRENISTLSRELEARPRLGGGALALFALGPIPTNQVFVATGIARTPLPPLVAVFVAARFVSYVVWIGAAERVAQTLAEFGAARLPREHDLPPPVAPVPREPVEMAALAGAVDTPERD